MPQAECVITAEVAAGATTIIWFAKDQSTYPELLRIEGRIPVDFIQFIGTGALDFKINLDSKRHFYLPAAGSLEIGDAKAHAISIHNGSAGALNFTMRLVSR